MGLVPFTQVITSRWKGFEFIIIKKACRVGNERVVVEGWDNQENLLMAVERT